MNYSSNPYCEVLTESSSLQNQIKVEVLDADETGDFEIEQEEASEEVQVDVFQADYHHSENKVSFNDDDGKHHKSQSVDGTPTHFIESSISLGEEVRRHKSIESSTSSYEMICGEPLQIKEEFEDNSTPLPYNEVFSHELNSGVDIAKNVPSTMERASDGSESVMFGHFLDVSTATCHYDNAENETIFEDYSETRFEDSEEHLENDNDQSYVCDYCGKSFNQKLGLIRHLRLVHPGCKICGKGSSYRLHNHTRQEKLQCNLCPKKFWRQMQLTEHKKMHHSCDCGKLFPNRSELLEHKRTHVDQYVYRCDICDNRFLRVGYLKQHRRLHFESDHECRICKERFPTMSMLKFHVNSHSGPKDYPTDIMEWVIDILMQEDE